MVSILFNQSGLSGAATGSVFGLTRRVGETHAPLHVSITGTAEVVVEGRISPEGSWVVLDTFTSSRMVFIGLVPRIRVRVVSSTAATVRAVLDAQARPVV
jgi:hypothetical protein